MSPSTRDFTRILKENLKEVAEAVLRKIIGIEAISVETLDTKLPITDEREADFILNVNDNKNQNFIVHLELQSTNADGMLYRMLRYYTYIRQTYNLSVRQYVIYIGRAPMNMENELFDADINYRYNLIDMRNIPYEKFLQSDKPEEVILAILCDFQDHSPSDSVKEILRRLKILVKQDELKKVSISDN